MDHQKIAHVNPRKHAVDGKFIIVFAEGAHHIVHVIPGSILFPHNRDVMVRTVHGRAHQVHSAGVHSDVFFICVLLMDSLCHERTVRPKHKPAELRAQGHIAHPRRDENFLVYLPHALPDSHNIVGLLVRAVRNAHAARQVDKGNMRSCLLLELHRQLKQNLCQHGIVFVGHRVACQKGVNAEILRPLGL